MSDDVQVVDVTTLAAVTKAEIDTAVATAKQWPRDEDRAMKKAEQFSCVDVPTAEECHFDLPRGDGVEGASIRFAEIMATSWGNLRIQTRVTGIESDVVVGEGICHDLESNVAIKREVRRSIRNRDGGRYNADMITVTGNAATAIAMRNAILAVIPRGQWYPIYEKSRELAGASPLKDQRRRAIQWFAARGVDRPTLFAALNVRGEDKLDARKIEKLRGWRVAISEGATTIEKVFGVKGKKAGTKAPPKERPEPEKVADEGSASKEELWAAFAKRAPDLPDDAITEIENKVGGAITKNMPIEDLRRAVELAYE